MKLLKTISDANLDHFVDLPIQFIPQQAATTYTLFNPAIAPLIFIPPLEPLTTLLLPPFLKVQDYYYPQMNSSTPTTTITTTAAMAKKNLQFEITILLSAPLLLLLLLYYMKCDVFSPNPNQLLILLGF